MSEEYDEDNQPVDQPTTDGKSEAEFKSEVQAREKEVTRLLNAGKGLDALPLVLDNPPTHAKTTEIKDQNATLVLNVLTQIKEKDVEASVNALNADQLDVLMKYIYRGLSSGEQAPALLKWHESVLKKSGLGTIVRALTERKTV